jgi:hypothetical protein
LKRIEIKDQNPLRLIVLMFAALLVGSMFLGLFYLWVSLSDPIIQSPQNPPMPRHVAGARTTR